MYTRKIKKRPFYIARELTTAKSTETPNEDSNSMQISNASV